MAQSNPINFLFASSWFLFHRKKLYSPKFRVRSIVEGVPVQVRVNNREAREGSEGYAKIFLMIFF
jgi:hypothetical protein